MSNIKSINSKINKISYKWKKYHYTFYFDDEYLYKNWKGNDSSGSRIYTLENLNPKFDKETFTDQKVIKNMRISITLLLFSVVFFFSDFNNHIPLLVPFLIIYSIIFFPKSIRRILPETWVYIFDGYGKHAVSLLIPDDESDEDKTKRKQFEKNLSKQIEKAIECACAI